MTNPKPVKKPTKTPSLKTEFERVHLKLVSVEKSLKKETQALSTELRGVSNLLHDHVRREIRTLKKNQRHSLIAAALIIVAGFVAFILLT